MNSSIYIFGNLGYGYDQYPNDYASLVFQKFYENATANTQVAVHRNGDLMYYAYIRKLYNKEYIGLCIVLNGIMFRGIKVLFDQFENFITDIVVRGNIIEFTEDGNIISRKIPLYEKQTEIDLIIKTIQTSIESLQTQKLPSVNLTISKNDFQFFSIDDDAKNILNSISNYAYTYIYKSNDYNTATLSSYSNKLSVLSKEKKEALQTIEKQKSDIASLKRAQKNYKLVIWLIVVIFVGLLCVMSYVSNTNVRIQGLESDKIELNAIIEEKVKELDKAQLDISNLQSTKNRLNTRILNLRKDSSSFVSKIANLESKLQDKELDIDMKFIEIFNLNEKIKEKDNEISRLKKQVPSKSSYNTSASSYGTTKTVGATISKMGPSYDNTYALWFSAQKKLRINSFYIKANKSGYITLGLYNSYGSLLTSKRVKVIKGETTKVSFSDFTISKGKYYLAIEKSNDISLCYHKVSGGEYNFSQFDVLQILGYSAKGEKTPNNNKSYYQYFYDINYTVLE